jgi:hypothetical protein
MAPFAGCPWAMVRVRDPRTYSKAVRMGRRASPETFTFAVPSADGFSLVPRVHPGNTGDRPRYTVGCIFRTMESAVPAPSTAFATRSPIFGGAGSLFPPLNAPSPAWVSCRKVLVGWAGVPTRDSDLPTSTGQSYSTVLVFSYIIYKPTPPARIKPIFFPCCTPSNDAISFLNVTN